MKTDPLEVSEEVLASVVNVVVVVADSQYRFCGVWSSFSGARLFVRQSLVNERFRASSQKR